MFVISATPSCIRLRSLAIQPGGRPNEWKRHKKTLAVHGLEGRQRVNLGISAQHILIRE